MRSSHPLRNAFALAALTALGSVPVAPSGKPDKRALLALLPASVPGRPATA